MAAANRISVEQSGAFVETFVLEPTCDGPLAGLRFGVKDLIDIAGHSTGSGNPTWKATHPRAVNHAVCVEQLLAAGGRCAGKTVTDELAFSLIGENHFHGTPLNPKAPARVPGGSSSGSAAAARRSGRSSRSHGRSTHAPSASGGSGNGSATGIAPAFCRSALVD